jgi:hypothetical protein
MSVVKRFNELLDLDEIDVLIDEVDKSRHIILSDIPDSLPQGRSSFLIETSPYMKQDTEIQIDFIDSEGSSIYTEPIADYLEGRARRVSVEVYDDTAPGIATLVIVGELIAVPDGNTIFADAEQVPQRFQGAYNVRLTKQIVINPTAVNTQPIKFFGQPIINVTETRVGTMVRSEVTGSITSSLFELEAVPTDEDLLFKPYGVNLNPSQGLLSEGAPSSPAKQRSLKAYIESRKRKNRKGKRKNSIFKRSGLLSKTNSPPSFPYRIRPGSFNGEESFRFNTGYVGGEVHFHTSSLGNTFGSSSFYPQAALTEAGLLETPTFDTEKEQGIVNTSASMYTASIVDLVSDRIIAVDKPFTNKNVNGEDIILPIFARGKIHYEAMPTASYAAANLVSYANVTLADMRTFSGDVYKVKVYVKSEGGFDDYKLLAEVPLEGKELLVDDASVGQGDRTGYFIEQNDIDNFWTVSGSVNGETPLGTPATNAAYNNDIMLDSVKLSGSLANPTDHLKFQLNDEYKFELIKGVDYNLSIDVIGNRSGSNYATLAFYISGSSMNRLDNLFYDEYADTEIVESSKYGKRLGTLTVKPEDDEIKDFQTVAQTFTPDISGDGVLQIRVLQGVWNIGDIAIGPAADTGFNPSLFQFKQEMPAELSHKRPDTFEFMAEFYDVNNNLSDTIAYKSGVQFTGTNMTITGEDNVLESNLFIGGDTTGSGMHLGGVTSTLPETGTSGAAGSGFMRSVGYMGFISASSDPVSGSHGFMIFSGSVLPDSGDDYKGVGLELVGASGSLKFRTNPSVFDVRADSFFVGRKHENSASGIGQFMSGSEGNIEISSSLFHLDPINDRLIIGAGTTINADLSVNQLFTPAQIGGSQSNITNASSSITSDGFAKFVSASIAGFTVNPIAIHSDNNNLVMSASGQITGSEVLFTGGKIANWSITGDKLESINASDKGIFLDADASTPIIEIRENDDNRLQLYHTSNSDWGIVGRSGGNVLFRLGDTNEIAGWTIGNQQITGGNLVLDKNGTIKSSNYQSDVAGFIITAEQNGYAEFENVRIRGTMATTTFEKESVNAVGGQLFVANSTALTGSAILAAATTMSVVNASGFENGEILVAKKVTNTGFNTEYIRVDSSSLDGDLSKDEVYGRIYVTRSISAAASENSSSIGDPIGTAQDYEPGQVLVSSGKIGTGYIRLNANPNNQATPYIDIIERTGSGVYDVQLKARLGDLKGVAGTRNVPANFDGFGLMSEVAFLSGSNIKLEAPTFLLGDLNQNFVSGSNSNIEISSSAFHLDTQNNVMNMSGSITASKALIGTPTGPRVSFDGTNFEISSSNFHLNADGDVTMSGTVTADAGNIAGFTIFGLPNAPAIASSDGSLILSGSGQITGSSMKISGSDIRISTPEFDLNDGTATLSGNILFQSQSADPSEGVIRIGKIGPVKTGVGTSKFGISIGRGDYSTNSNTLPVPAVIQAEGGGKAKMIRMDGDSKSFGAMATAPDPTFGVSYGKQQIAMGLNFMATRVAAMTYDVSSASPSMGPGAKPTGSGFTIDTFTTGTGERFDNAHGHQYVNIQSVSSGSVTICKEGVPNHDNTGGVSIFSYYDNTIQSNYPFYVKAGTYIDGNARITGELVVDGDLDVDGTTNLDAVDIDGAVDMASNLDIAGNLDVDGTTDLDATNIVGAVSIKGDTTFVDANSSDTIVKIHDSNDDGLVDVYANNSVKIRLHGNGHSYFSNDVSIGGTEADGDAAPRLTVYQDDANFVASFVNSTNNTAADGIMVNYTANSALGSSAKFIQVRDSSDDVCYEVKGGGSGNSTVVTSFTAGHDTACLDEDELMPGLIIESTGEVWYKPSSSFDTALPYTRLSNTNGSKTVFGVVDGVLLKYDVSGSVINADKGEQYVKNGYYMPPAFTSFAKYAPTGSANRQLNTMSIGEGVVWVTNINGEIENGDYIESSVIKGYGRKQNDDILRSKTVAKCTETIDWTQISSSIEYSGSAYKKYKCSATFHCG